MSQEAQAAGAPLRSMTGYASVEGRLTGAAGTVAWRWTLRSVNAKGLDLKLRLPPGFEAAEPLIKRHDHGLHRGSIAAALKLERDSAETALRVDGEALGAVLAAIDTVSSRVKTAKPRPEAILALGGVLKAGPEAMEPGAEEIGAVVAGFAQAAEALGAARAEEGAALEEVLHGQLDEIERLTLAAEAQGPAAAEALAKRLEEQIKALLAEKVPEERLAPEAALLAVKADIREETDRLKAHVAAARSLLGEGRAVGRKLEFLAQEFAREANTLTAKAPAMSLKRIGLDLKHVVDQLREQVLNVE